MHEECFFRESHVQNPDYSNVEERSQQRRPLSQPWLPIWGIIHSLCSSSSFIGSYHFNVLPTALGKKRTWFCFHKRRELEIYILGFISNPYKNTCLERILIKFHLEMIDRCNRPIWSQFLQQHKM